MCLRLEMYNPILLKKYKLLTELQRKNLIRESKKNRKKIIFHVFNNKDMKNFMFLYKP